MTALLIANPWASGVDEDRLAGVRAELPAGTELRLTSARGDAIEIAREVSGRVAALYVFGGDGTFNEVLNGIDDSTPLGFIPGGGTSVLPRALGIPRGSAQAARRLTESARPRRIGLGRVNGRRFGFASGVGLDAEIVRAVDDLGRRSDGRRPGNLTFAWTGLRTLARHNYRLDPALEINGHGRAAFALVSNGPSYSYAGPCCAPAGAERELRGRPRPGRANRGSVARHPADRPPCPALGRPGERPRPRLRARRRSARDRVRSPASLAGGRRGSRRRGVRRFRGRAGRRHRSCLVRSGLVHSGI